MPRGVAPGPHIEAEPAYVLHTRAYRESSQLLELLTPGHGRMGAIARGAKGGKGGGRAALLQPFSPVLVGWQGTGDLVQLTDIEAAAIAPRLLGDALLAGFYANELLVQLLPRAEAQPGLFARYALLLAELAEGPGLAWPLRCFEHALLAVLGLAPPVDVDVHGQPLEAEVRYRWLGDAGAQRLGVGEAEGIEGAALLALHSGIEPASRHLGPLRRLLRTELQRHLHGRELRSWGLLAELERLRS